MSEAIKGAFIRWGHDVDFYYIQGNIPDISSSTAQQNSVFVIVPEKGLIVEIKTSISTAITSADADWILFRLSDLHNLIASCSP